MRTVLPLILTLAFAVGCGAGDSDNDGFTADVDCDDTNEAIHPDASEVCDGVDNNCDGFTDDATATDATAWFVDADGDSFGGASITLVTCEQPAGFVADNTDCDDLLADVSPNGKEVCDGLDNDCDGKTDAEDDDVDITTVTTYYKDADGDGYGLDADTVDGCSVPAGYAAAAGDCNDDDKAVNPETVWFADIDGDTYGALNFTTTSCEKPDGYTSDDTDCDDLDAEINPAATEICDALDNDCDESIDDADPDVDVETMSSWYLDNDEDGYGDPAISVVACAPPAKHLDNDADCDDSTSEINPKQTEVCNDGLDNNCDGGAPECMLASGDATLADYTFTGNDYYDYFGRETAMVDLNGDGVQDLVVAAYGDDDNGSTSGTVSVFMGTVSADADAADADINWSGDASGDYFGYSLANLGDVNGDGYEDLLIGGYYAEDDLGAAYLVTGAKATHTGGDISDDATATWVGGDDYDYFGHSAAGYGDLDADGYADFGMGAYADDEGASGSGSVYLVYGAKTITGGTGADADAHFYGGESGDEVGYLGSHDGVGDIDGDGSIDLLIGGSDAFDGYGGAYLFYGTGSRFAGKINVKTGSDATFEGDEYYDYFGRRVAGAGDLDGDGYGDFVVSQYDGGDDLGEVVVYAGGATQMSGDYTMADAAINMLGDADYDDFGAALHVADINNDGKVDLLIGAPYNDDAYSSAGAMYVFYGDMDETSYTASDADVTITGTESGDALGYQSIATGDNNGDGVNDVLVGAYYGADDLGETYLFLGNGM